MSDKILDLYKKFNKHTNRYLYMYNRGGGFMNS